MHFQNEGYLSRVSPREDKFVERYLSDLVNLMSCCCFDTSKLIFFRWWKRWFFRRRLVISYEFIGRRVVWLYLLIGLACAS